MKKTISWMERLTGDHKFAVFAVLFPLCFMCWLFFVLPISDKYRSEFSGHWIGYGSASSETKPTSFVLILWLLQTWRAEAIWPVVENCLQSLQMFSHFTVLSFMELASLRNKKVHDLIALKRPGRAGPWWAGMLHNCKKLTRNVKAFGGKIAEVLTIYIKMNQTLRRLSSVGNKKGKNISFIVIVFQYVDETLRRERKKSLVDV